MSKRSQKFTPILPVLSLSLIFLASIGADAQTSRQQRRSTPIPSPTPAATEPLIISRAEDFPDENSQAIPPEPIQQIAVPVNAPPGDTSLEDLGNRIKALEAGRKDDYDAKQKRLLLNLDILTRAEQRAESLRKQLFEMAEKESTIKTKLDAIDNDIRPEMIERNVAFAGSLRPEELRAARKKNLDAERSNLQNLLTEIQRTRSNLDQNVTRADALVEKLRLKLEKDIDDALADDPELRPQN